MANSQEIAQINEINKGLTALNDTLTKTSTSYLTLVKTIADGSATVKNSAISYENLEKAQKQTAENSKQLDSIGRQLIQSEEKLKQTEDKRLESIIKNRTETQKATQAIKDKLKANDAEEGSLIRMRQRLKELTAEYDRTGKRTKEAANEINTLSREIGKAEAATNRHSRGVGGYSDQLGKLGDKMNGLPGIAGRASSSVTGLVSSISKLGPIGAIIGGSIMAISAPLVAFFTKSENGVEMLERKTAGFKAAWNVLVGEMISGGEKMASVLEDEPKKASTFWTGFMSMFGASGAILGSKMDTASKAASNYTRSLQELEDSERALIVPREQANLKIKEAMLLYNQEGASIETKLNALRTAIDLENQTADVEIEHQKRVVEVLKKVNKEKEAVRQLRDEDDLKLQQAMAKQIQLETDSLGRQSRATARMKAARQELLKDSEENAKKEKEIVIKLEKEKADAILEGLKLDEEKNKEMMKNNSDFEKIYQDQIDMALESDQKEFDNWYDLAKKKKEEDIKLAEEAAKQKKEIEEQLTEAKWELAAASVDALFTLNSYRLEKEMADLEKEKELKLSNKNLSEAQKVKIEEDFQKKSNAIKLKQAKNEKLQSLFSIAISTAQASMKTLAQVPLPAGAALLAATIALGAIQAGLVMAQPLPKFAKGTDNAPSKGLFGEAGRELMFLKSGEVMMADRPTYFSGSKFKGAQIISNPETESMIKQAGASGMSGRGMNDNRIVSELRGVKNAIKSIPSPIVDKDYRQIGVKTSKHQEIYLNRLTRN